MCIVFVDYQPDGSKPYLLILANNRDEEYDRPTVDLNYWSDYPNILAGSRRHTHLAHSCHV